MESRIIIREYLTKTGQSPFGKWFASLKPVSAAKVTTALIRLENGNFSNVKGVGGGVFEYRIDTGPGYRIYFGKDGETLVILLGGSTKRRQDAAIQAAKDSWKAYRQAKAEGDPEWH